MKDNKKYIIFHRVQNSDMKLYFGTHRNEESIFQADMFANYRPNAYQYFLEDVQAKITELQQLGWTCEYELKDNKS